MTFITKNTIRHLALIFTASLLSGIFFILPDFIIYPTTGLKGTIYTILHWGLNCIPLFFLYYLLSINKYVFAVTIPPLFLVGTLIGYYSYFYKATLTPMILDATFHNDIGTSLDVISPLLIVFVVLSIFISILFIRFRFRKISISKPVFHLLCSLTILILLFSINKRVTTSFYQHFPFSLYYNFSEYRKLNTNKNLDRTYPDTVFNYNSEENLTVVFIIGESLRADHLSINGYHRNTTPLLAKQNNLVSYTNIYSEYTYTNPSVAHIMTRADSVHTERSKTETSFVTQFNNSGFYTSWIANQDAAITYYSFMAECDTLIYVNPQKSVYTYSNWIDEDILPEMDKMLDRNDKNRLLILHTIGNHWYYDSHYSEKFKVFKPTTRSKILTQNTTEEMTNSYDNSILYTDFFIDSVIKRIEGMNAILIYLSDHGEALGEEGNWLHASDNKYLKNPACLVWYSDIYKEKYGEKVEALKANSKKRYRTDFLYHSILSAAKIPSSIIEDELDIFWTSSGVPTP